MVARWVATATGASALSGANGAVGVRTSTTTRVQPCCWICARTGWATVTWLGAAVARGGGGGGGKGGGGGGAGGGPAGVISRPPPQHARRRAPPPPQQVSRGTPAAV